MKKNIIIYIGIICLVLSILGQTLFNWSGIICSLLAGVFLLTLFKGSESARKNRDQKEQERRERIKSLGR